MLSTETKDMLVMMLGENFRHEGDVIVLPNSENQTYTLIKPDGSALGKGSYKAVARFLSSRGFIIACVSRIKEYKVNRDTIREASIEYYNANFEYVYCDRVRLGMAGSMTMVYGPERMSGVKGNLVRKPDGMWELTTSESDHRHLTGYFDYTSFWL